MNSQTRMESDSIGTLQVPYNAYYGVQTLRAKENFPITGNRLHPAFIANMARIKKAAAMTNRMAGKLQADKAEAIVHACEEIINGKLQDQFIVDAIQGGAGTSANMNMNEVVANRANELAGKRKGEYSFIHPNDDVNMAQSTNDVIPTAGKLTVLDLIEPLDVQLGRLRMALLQKAETFDDILKIGRTQLQDAVPMRLGQSFHAYATMVARDQKRLEAVRGEMYALNLGATAIGTSINASSFYLAHCIPVLSKLTGYPLCMAEDLFDATENLDGFVTVSHVLKCMAVDLSKMCNDLRLLSSGPRAGLGEINLPARQNGSSIMPGKVNPVIPEVVSQVAFHVIGHDVTITMAAEAGQMELNAFEPVAFYNLFDSLTTLREAVATLTDHCILGITANAERCRALLEGSTGTATALSPYLGYQMSAEIAKESLRTGVFVRKIVLRDQRLTSGELDLILDPDRMTGSADAQQEYVS